MPVALQRAEVVGVAQLRRERLEDRPSSAAAARPRTRRSRCASRSAATRSLSSSVLSTSKRKTVSSTSRARDRRLGLEERLRLLQRRRALPRRPSGSAGRAPSALWTITADAANRASHLRSAGITYHGAHSVLVWESISENARWYSSQKRRSSTSAAENFQLWSGRSIRLRKRSRCSSFDTYEEQLHDAEAVVREVPLPVVDLAVASLPNVAAARRLRQLLPCEQRLVHADDEHLLVMGAV